MGAVEPRCGEDDEGRICDRVVDAGECVIHGPVGPELPEPSREDRYEAAVRAVLELCDQAEARAARRGIMALDAVVDADRIRAAIRDALLPTDAPMGEDRAPVSISGPGAGSARIGLSPVPGGPEAGTQPARIDVEIVEAPRYARSLFADSDLWPRW
ncbi:hypothetical protein SEA_ALTADENA_67 [Arthrobacter phage Altadena]|uniref:Uncharacterized protein n=1 Tax=Arthrobacter phage Altadena TaxID=3059064 RepID=A0AA96KHS2_9CAUD|nr:hypothetical protein SEA_ALTADENA_67 [Arthrobacter phage Altadena]